MGEVVEVEVVGESEEEKEFNSDHRAPLRPHQIPEQYQSTDRYTHHLTKAWRQHHAQRCVRD